MVDAVLAGSPKPVVQRVESRTVRSSLLTATNPVAWRNCVSVSSSTWVRAHVPVTKVRGSRRSELLIFMSLLAGMVAVGGRP